MIFFILLLFFAFFLSNFFCAFSLSFGTYLRIFFPKKHAFFAHFSAFVCTFLHFFPRSGWRISPTLVVGECGWMPEGGRPPPQCGGKGGHGPCRSWGKAANTELLHNFPQLGWGLTQGVLSEEWRPGFGQAVRRWSRPGGPNFPAEGQIFPAAVLYRILIACLFQRVPNSGWKRLRMGKYLYEWLRICMACHHCLALLGFPPFPLGVVHGSCDSRRRWHWWRYAGIRKCWAIWLSWPVQWMDKILIIRLVPRCDQGSAPGIQQTTCFLLSASQGRWEASPWFSGISLLGLTLGVGGLLPTKRRDTPYIGAFC